MRQTPLRRCLSLGRRARCVDILIVCGHLILWSSSVPSFLSRGHGNSGPMLILIVYVGFIWPYRQMGFYHFLYISRSCVTDSWCSRQYGTVLNLILGFLNKIVNYVKSDICNFRLLTKTEDLDWTEKYVKEICVCIWHGQIMQARPTPRLGVCILSIRYTVQWRGSFHENIDLHVLYLTHTDRSGCM